MSKQFFFSCCILYRSLSFIRSTQFALSTATLRRAIERNKSVRSSFIHIFLLFSFSFSRMRSFALFFGRTEFRMTKRNFYFHRVSVQLHLRDVFVVFVLLDNEKRKKPKEVCSAVVVFIVSFGTSMKCAVIRNIKSRFFSFFFIFISLRLLLFRQMK